MTDLNAEHKRLKARVEESFNVFLQYFKEYEVFVLKHRDFKFEQEVIQYHKRVLRKKKKSNEKWTNLRS